MKSDKFDSSVYAEKTKKLLRENVANAVVGSFIVGFFSAYIVFNSQSLGSIFSSNPNLSKAKSPNDYNFIDSLLSKSTTAFPKEVPVKSGDLQLPDEGQTSSIQTTQVTNSNRTYIVELGDTMGIIAQKVYGDPNAWLRIANANKNINPDFIEVGMKLEIPR